MRVRLVIIGFGTVGQGFAELLVERRDVLRAHGIEPRVVAICDTIKGNALAGDGLDLAAALKAVRTGGALAGVAPEAPPWDALEFIRRADADVIVEATYTNFHSGEPALSHVRAAIEAGRHVLTTNKGPFAVACTEVLALAARRGVFIGFEGTVMSGTPVIKLCTELLAAASIRSFRGVVNGSTNYILTLCQRGLTFDEALADAQRCGYCEAVPDADVDGWDAAAKVAILANVALAAPMTIHDVARGGIRGLTARDLEEARAAGDTYKLVASAARTPDGVTASVGPRRLSHGDPLAGLSGAANGLVFDTDPLGEIMITGPGAGRRETGYALIGDLLALARRGPYLAS